MKPVAILLLAALPITVACSSNKPPVTVASSPPIVDLNCPPEPDVAAMLVTDPSGLSFDMAVRAAGQECRQALARVCRWHKERGTAVTCPTGLPSN